MIDSLLSTGLSLSSSAATLLARAPTSDEIWGRIAQIAGTTIFSVIIIWVVIKIWNGEFLAGDDEDDGKKEK